MTSVLSLSNRLNEWALDDHGKTGEAVANAHKLDNPLSKLSLEDITLKNGKVAKIEHFKAKELSADHLKWILDLMERNMKKMYRKSDGGWKAKAKKKEMTQETSRYLIAFCDGKPTAFSHFQFDMDYGREVLYCYEIQVEAHSRSCGLGRQIMETLDKIVKEANLAMVVLTVFKFNLTSIEFFKSLGYTVDETNPGEEEKKDYTIFSKKALVKVDNPCPDKVNIIHDA